MKVVNEKGEIKNLHYTVAAKLLKAGKVTLHVQKNEQLEVKKIKPKLGRKKIER